MQGLKLIHVSKRGPRFPLGASPFIKINFSQLWQTQKHKATEKNLNVQRPYYISIRTSLTNAG